MTEDPAKIYKALSDVNRLRILKMLRIKPLCVCEITDTLQLAISTVSKHLSILKESGFIIEEKDGKWVNYKHHPQPPDHRIATVLGDLDSWIVDDAVFRDDENKVRVVDRHQVCNKKYLV